MRKLPSSPKIKKAHVLYFFACMLAFWTFHTVQKNAPAYKMQGIIEQELEARLKIAEKDDRIPLRTIGGIEWDWVCGIGIYTDGLTSMKRFFYMRNEKYDLSSFSVANENLLDNEYGLTFLSFDKKMLVTIATEYRLQHTSSDPR